MLPKIGKSPEVRKSGVRKSERLISQPFFRIPGLTQTFGLMRDFRTYADSRTSGLITYLTLPFVTIMRKITFTLVLLSLILSAAFYAVQQKAKTAGPDYKPSVEVITTQQNGSVIISVKDNGNGIPDAIKDKIMQPFFTTKPTGEGTGLGLSLSYDIVVKGHEGKIEVETKEGEFTEFTVTLPLS
ncbi:MAG: GHKL domain-containing protein [Bacteroidetes bacterium]|nr:GHKL domain-containing protein [Bacteroidota bacterium]